MKKQHKIWNLNYQHLLDIFPAHIKSFNFISTADLKDFNRFYKLSSISAH